MTAIFVAPPSVSSTLNVDFSSFASPEVPPEAGAATAAAETPNFSSKCLTSSCRSKTDIFSIISTIVLNLAGVCVVLLSSILIVISL